MKISKNNKKIITPLTSEIRNIFESISKSGEYVFSTTLGLKPLNCFSKVKKKI